MRIKQTETNTSYTILFLSRRRLITMTNIFDSLSSPKKRTNIVVSCKQRLLNWDWVLTSLDILTDFWGFSAILANSECIEILSLKSLYFRSSEAKHTIGRINNQTRNNQNAPIWSVAVAQWSHMMMQNMDFCLQAPPCLLAYLLYTAMPLTIGVEKSRKRRSVSTSSFPRCTKAEQIFHIIMA